MIREVICLFLEGRTELVEKELARRMTEAADDYDFERAARIRDQLAAVRKRSESRTSTGLSGTPSAWRAGAAPLHPRGQDGRARALPAFRQRGGDGRGASRHF